MKVAIQINNFNQIGKTTIYLIEEALNRGHTVFVYPVDKLSLDGSKIIAKGRLLEESNEKFDFSEDFDIDLDKMDLILMRNDPPFDARYITATYILERCSAAVLNDPKSVRNLPEKFVNYDGYKFNTLITEDMERIKSFCEEYGKPFVVKPLYSHGGNDIKRFDCFTEESEAEIKELIKKYNAPIVVQEFCDKVLTDGDRRIVLLKGGILGCFRRKNDKSFIVNTCLGGEFLSYELTPTEKAICVKISADLNKMGIMLAGVDMLDGRITEINVTSIAGVRELNQLYNINAASICWSAFEERVWSRTTLSDTAR